MKYKSILVAVAACCLLGSAVWPAFAFNPQEANAIYEIQLATPQMESAAAADIQGLASTYARSASQSLGGRWYPASWNPQTGTGYLLGSGVDVAAPFAGADDVARAAQALIAAHPETFRAELGSLRLINTPYALGKWAANFQQTYAGLDVWGGTLNLTFTDAGRLFALGSSCYPNIAVDVNPSVTLEQAKQMAISDLPYDPANDSIEPESQLLILPVATSRSETEFHLVWRLRVHTADPLGIWVTHVDAHSGQIIWRYNDICFTDFTGDATGGVQPDTYCNGIEDIALKYMRVQVAGVGETNTAQNGTWTVPYGGNDAHTVTAGFYGPYITVNNYNGAEAQWSQSVTPATPAHIIFNDANARRDERDPFDAVNDLHDFIEQFDPGFSYTQQRITCYVNRTDGYCPGNAWWDGTINFCAAGGQYANTGEQQGVVEHEYGHGIEATLVGSQGNEGCGEGNSDVTANLLTQESIIGRGFYSGNCTSGIRNSLNTLIYPDDVVGQEIHFAGQVIAGFHWDFMVLLQAEYGTDQGTLLAAERWHFGRELERPVYQVDQVIATFIADDDDGNLENGTPHWNLLWEAAANHGFDHYLPELRAISFQHTPPPSTDHATDADIVATITDNMEVPLIADSIQVFYRINGDPGDTFQQVRMTPTGNPNEYHALFNDLNVPTEFEYYLYARDEADSIGTAPRGAPDVLFAFDVANVYDPMEVESGWQVDIEGTDDASTGLWERLDPVGTEAQPENDHTPDGTLCWVTGNAQPGEPGGTNDVDGGATSLYSPVYDLSNAQNAKAKFFRWYSNNMGNNPNSDTWVVQVRNNGGAWMDVERNQNEQNSWAYREVDLSAMFGEALGSVQLKFVASDASPGSLVEACVDDFVIIGADFSGTPDAISGQPCFAFQGSRVNPALGATEIVFQVPVSSHVELTLHDVSGRTVRTLANEKFAPGVHAIAWDGRDDSGRAIASGVYYCHMQAPGFEATRTIVLGH